MPRREMGDVALIKGNEATAKFWVIEVEGRNQLRLVVEDVIAELNKVDIVDGVDRGLDCTGGCIVTSILTLGAYIIEIAVISGSCDRIVSFW